MNLDQLEHSCLLMKEDTEEHFLVRLPYPPEDIARVEKSLNTKSGEIRQWDLKITAYSVQASCSRKNPHE